MSNYFDLFFKRFPEISANARLLAVMQTILDENGLSRTEITGKFDISKALVSKYIDQLLQANIVEEAESVESARGRRPVVLKLRSNLFFCAGLDFYDSTEVRGAIINAHGETVVEKNLSLPLEISPEEKCARSAALLAHLAEVSGIAREAIAGCGVSLTGILSPETGEVVSSAQFQSRRIINVVRLLRKRWELDYRLINCSHLSALLEKRLGHARNMRNFLSLVTGYGLGIMIDGKLYRGHQLNAGEAGYMQIAGGSGRTDADGRRGTLNQLAALHRITDQLEEIVRSGGYTRAAELKGEHLHITLDAVIDACAAGDQLCGKLISDHFEVIGKAVVNLAYIFNPEAIFLPEWTSRCREVSVDVVNRQMGHYGTNHWGLKTQILSSACRADDFAAGAALLPLLHCFSDQTHIL